MKDKCFFDTNIWLYFLVSKEGSKLEIVNSLIADNLIVLSTQVINEVGRVLLQKYKLPELEVKNILSFFYDNYNVTRMSKSVVLKAFDLRQKYGFSYWDSLIVSAALRSKAKILYSEDMHNGLLIDDNKIKIINPFIAD